MGMEMGIPKMDPTHCATWSAEIYCYKCNHRAKYVKQLVEVISNEFVNTLAPVCGRCCRGPERLDMETLSAPTRRKLHDQLFEKKGELLDHMNRGHTELAIELSGSTRTKWDNMPYGALSLIFEYASQTSKASEVASCWSMRLVSRRWYDAFMRTSLRIDVPYLRVMLKCNPSADARVPTNMHSSFWIKLLSCISSRPLHSSELIRIGSKDLILRAFRGKMGFSKENMMNLIKSIIHEYAKLDLEQEAFDACDEILGELNR